MGKKVALIDKGHPASGMTSRSTALVRNHYSNEIVARMAHYSLNVLRDFGEIGSSGFVNNGMLFLGNSAFKEIISSVLPMLTRVGVKTEYFEREEAIKRFPELKLVEEGDFVDYEPESGYADPVATANSYVLKARELGAEVLVGREVARINKDVSGNVERVEFADGGNLHCSKVVICTNVWTNRLLANSLVSEENVMPLWAAAHPVVIFRRPKQYEGLHPNIADFTNKTYYKPEGNSLFFAGSLDPEFDSRKVEPESAPTEVPFEYLNFFSEVVSRRIPFMREGVLHSSYIGMYDMTPDQHPIIDELSQVGLPGAYCCVGLSGHGFKLCPALGLMTAEMVCETEAMTFDWRYFSLSRFKTGKLLSTKYSSLNTIA